MEKIRFFKIKFSTSGFLFIFFLLLPLSINATSLNGFDLSNTSINTDEILAGGPPKDGIPAINNPKFIPASKVDYLKDTDLVLGVIRGKIARAYPFRILVWHEIVNDEINGEALAITYCPLCGTGMVFSRFSKGKKYTFGVSGLLYQSDVLLYDQESQSLWSQLGMHSVSGQAIGSPLQWLSSEHITWKAWKTKYPNSDVLSTDTGFNRNYNGSAYASYFASAQTLFPVKKNRNELPQKEWVIGVILDGKAKAYPVKNFTKKTSLLDSIGNKKIEINYDPETKQHQLFIEKGKRIPSVLVFWFAWQAFYPQTELLNS